MRWTVLLAAMVFLGCDDAEPGGGDPPDATMGAGGEGGAGAAGGAGGTGGEGGEGGVAGMGGEGGAIEPACGDGVVDDDETCDDGNTIPGDGCSATCALECGDGVVGEGEACDDGNVADGDGCSATCTLECGDGQVTGAEECDDGNTDADDGCSATCTLECGDGQVTGAEECDDGNTDADDGCSATCAFECGDGVVGGAEACDDGNREADDGCSATCTLECGDGQVTGAEECDDGNTDPDDGCSATCAFECGDGVVGGAEACDDGNREADDGCSPTCTLECGDGVVTGAEACDDGNRDDDDGCSASCTVECGDGAVTGAEECDDGNTAANDGCSATCTLECGDGVVTGAEACDDGNREADDGCSATCTVECGDGAVTGAEECDDGNTDAGDGCSATCTVECGDGAVTGAEECDDGNREADDGCSATCTVECGDGAVTGAEECDDGNREADDGCSATCTVECGDGAVTGIETCDDGNRDAGDGCSAACVLEPPLCGNGFLSAGVEECDDGNTDAGDGCSATCTIEPIEVGDGGTFAGGFNAGALDRYRVTLAQTFTLAAVVEAADGAEPGCPAPGVRLLLYRIDGAARVLQAETADACQPLAVLLQPATYEYEVRHAAGLPAYAFTVERQTICGNAAIEGDEACDDGNQVDGDGCEADCTPSCGNGVVDPVESCDDGNAIDGDGCSAACVDEAVDVSAGGDFIGGVGVGETDFYRLVLADETAVQISTGDGVGGCPGDTLIGVFEMRPEGPFQRAVVDDGGVGECAAYDALLPAGTYQIRVLGGAAAGAVPVYTLTVGFGPSCGNARPEAGEECDDGNAIDGDGCDASCLVEGLLDVSAGGEFPRPGIDADTREAFRLILDRPGTVLVSTRTDDPICAAADTIVRIFDVNGVVVAENDDNPEPAGNRCSAVAATLDPGTYRVEVVGFDDGAIPAYTLVVDYAPNCGDGVLEVGEQCDDGNQPEGACDDQCLNAAVDISAGGAFPILIPAGRGNRYRLRLDAASFVRFESTDGAGGCPGNSLMRVFEVKPDGSRTALGENDDSPDNAPCSLLEGSITAGIYDVELFNIGADDIEFVLEVQIGGTCGDGERTPDEQCDDGNLIDGDACSATCQTEIVDVSAGGDFDAGFGAGQRDFFSFVIGVAGDVVLSTSDGAGGCPGDTAIQLLQQQPDGSFAQIAVALDGPLAPCAALQQNLQPGTYVAIVSGGAAVPAYVLSVDLGQPVLDLGAGGVFERPGFAAGQADVLPLTLAVASEVTIFTSNADGSLNCVAGTDTLMTLLDADGGQLAVNDDTAGRGFCSEISGVLPAGTYTVRIAGFDDGAVGPFRVTAQILPQ